MLGRREVPNGLSPARAWRWCFLRALRDARLARRKGRPIAKHHLARLFMRRWNELADYFGELDKNWSLRRLRDGSHFIGKDNQ